MQLYALDHLDQPVFIKHAAKGKDYHCLECSNLVRVRSGLHRQPHFYHLQPLSVCRLSGKTMQHLQVQWFLFDQLPAQDCQLEYRFPSIGRIADVAWLSQKIVFEVQCSSITAAEVAQRNADYEQLGWRVVWILHDSRYNQKRLSAAEVYLENFPHYFTTIDAVGKGYIYDQLSVRQKGERILFSPRLPLSLPSFFTSPFLQKREDLAKMLQNRAQDWPFYFAGDSLDVSLNKRQSQDMIDFFVQFDQFERAMQENKIKYKGNRVRNSIHRLFIRPYSLLFQMLLEKMCR